MSTLSPFSGSPESLKNEITVASPVQGAAVAAAAAPAKPATKSKPRKRVNTAEKRHQHNAIERQRRETLNGKFISLARLLPSLASHRRPSKSAIVNGSIAHLTHQRDQRLLAAKLLRKLCADRDELFNEVNEWRKANGYPPKEGASAWTDEMEDVCSVEKEVFGTFANMDGDDNDNDDDEANEMATDQAISFASIGNGLITPRSSTEVDMAQGMFQLPVDPKRAATISGLTWSHEFPFGGSVSSNSSLPFNAFMSDSLDQSSTGSPANSHQGNVLTPPTTADTANVFTGAGGATHTPSPRSSHSGGADDHKPAPAQQWTAQQMLFFQQQMQQQQLHRSHSTPVFANHNHGHGHFGHGHGHGHGQQFAFQPQLNNGTPDFSQALLEQMFPQQPNSTIGADQVEQWRKFALGNLVQQRENGAPSVAELKNAVRQGMGLGMNMANLWSENPQTVEGF